VIDIHTHLLPAVDDGSPHAEHSAVVLSRMLREGVRAVVCTPHLNASAAQVAPVTEHLRLLEHLRGAAPAGITLYPGWEIMLDRPGTDLRSAALGLAESRARLVEFPRRGLPSGATEELLRLRQSGVLPVVAHPERYFGCDAQVIKTWRELGVVIQTDANALLGTGTLTQRAREFLSEGLIDILASDNHGDRRSLQAARTWLIEVGASEQAGVLTEENPRRLLTGQELLPVAPVSLRKGILVRLRELVNRSSRASNDNP
jgi:protein-tyrosine phosphatase